jgi:hypothetical protein
VGELSCNVANVKRDAYLRFKKAYEVRNFHFEISNLIFLTETFSLEITTLN